MSQVVDGVLKEWGDRLFYAPVKGKKGRNVCGGRARSTEPGKPTTAAGVKSRLTRTTGRAPEVMVKISGGGKNMGQIKAHLDYISRNGEVELEDENGAILRGVDDVREVRDAWAKGKIGIPQEGERRREAFNIVLSMPPGTDRAAVKNAARQFAAEQFGNHQYVFAAHEDEKHPHVHLAVKAVDKSGVRMNPRKADLQAWREHFADKLREQGIAANATPRRARGVVQKAEKQAVRWIDKQHREGKRSAPSRAKAGRAAAVAQELAGKGAHANPAAGAITERRKKTVHAYGQLARALAQSPDAADKQLALNIVGFVQSMPQIRSRHQIELEAARTAVNKGGTERGREQQREAARQQKGRDDQEDRSR